MVGIGAGLKLQRFGECLGGGLYDGPRYSDYTDENGVAQKAPISWTQKYGGVLRCNTTDWSAAPITGGTFITLQDVVTTDDSTNLIGFDGPLKDWVDSKGRAGVTKTGAGWPVHVTIKFTLGVYNYATGTVTSVGTVTSGSANGIALKPGSIGSGDPNAIDLIVDIEGDGRTAGIETDGFKCNGGTDVNVTTGSGAIRCGPCGAGAHQDGVQTQGGDRIGFYGCTIGEWSRNNPSGNPLTTARCDGGAFFFSDNGLPAPNTNFLRTCKLVKCRIVAGGKGLRSPAYGAKGFIVDTVVRGGNPRNQTDNIATSGVVNANNFRPFVNIGEPTIYLTNVITDDWQVVPNFNPSYDSGAAP